MRRFTIGLIAGIIVVAILIGSKLLGLLLLAVVLGIAAREMLRIARPALPSRILNPLLIIMVLSYVLFISGLCVYVNTKSIYFSNGGLAGMETGFHPNTDSLLTGQAWCQISDFFLMLIPFCLIGVFLVIVYRAVVEYPDGELPLQTVFYIAATYTLLFVGLASFAMIYTFGPGYVWFLVLLLSWGADAGAFFTGKALGRRKLCSNVSPKKTVEGLIGCIMTGAIALPAFLYLTVPAISRLDIVMIGFSAVFGAIIAGLGHLGDLYFSLVKRLNERKESGVFLPEHGGVLDKIDSLLVVSPLFVIVFIVFNVLFR